MKAVIKKIRLYTDNIIEIDVTCPKCKQYNTHTITHASSKTHNTDFDNILINFNNLGSRLCHNTSCYFNYKLY